MSSDDYFDSDPCFTDLLDFEVSEPTFDDRFKCFNCLGEVDVKTVKTHYDSYIHRNEKTFVENVLLNEFPEYKKELNEIEDVELFGKNWDRGSVCLRGLDMLFSNLSMQIMILDNYSKDQLGSFLKSDSAFETSIFMSIRKQCVELCIFLRSYLSSVCSKTKYFWLLKILIPQLTRKLNILRQQLNRLTELPSFVHQNCASSAGNKSTQPSYHLFHLHLDLRWMHLTLLLILTKSKELSDSDSQEFGHSEQSCRKDLSKFVHFLSYDLMDLALARFQKMDVKDLPRKSSFHCSCVLELWALFQYLTDGLNSKEDQQYPRFWSYVDEEIEILLNRRSRADSDALLFELPKSYPEECPNVVLFGLWVLYHLAIVYKNYDQESPSNYSLLEGILRVLVNEDVSESSLRISLSFVDKLCTELWEPKTGPLLIMWEYYQKRLNNAFFIPGSTPDSLAVSAKTGLALVGQVKGRLEDRSYVNDSYDHFLRLIGVHLKQSRDNPRHWNLIKGRVYSKTSPARIADLNEMGEYHLISLFLTLAVCGDVSQVKDKLIEVFNCSFKFKGRLTPMMLKGRLALSIILVENNQNISKVLNETTSSFDTGQMSDDLNLYRTFIDGFQDILESNSNLNLGQHLFFGEWIRQYFKCCTSADSIKLLDTFIIITSRIKSNDLFEPGNEVILLIEKLWDELEAFLQNVPNHEVLPTQLGDLSADLSYIFLKMSNYSRFKSIFNNMIFHSGVRLSRTYLCQIIRFNELPSVIPNYEKIIAKAWIRCCLLCPDNCHSEIQQISRKVVSFSEFSNYGHKLLEDVIESDEPFVEFVSAIHEKYVNATDIYEKQHLREKVCNYFDGLDKWIEPVLHPPKKIDQIERIYFVVGNIIKLISPVIYVKSRPNSLLQQLINVMLLPLAVHKPDAIIHTYILSSVKKTLHLFAEGLYQLGPQSDPYVSRTFKEIISVYIPRCIGQPGTLSSSGLHGFKLVTNFNLYSSSMCSMILDSICQPYLKKKARSPHIYASQTLKFIKEVFTIHGSQESVFINIVKNSLERICDVLLHCDEQTPAYKLAKDIAKSVFNSNVIRTSKTAMDETINSLSNVCSEHLAWSSKQLFDFMITISSVAPDIVFRFLPTLLHHIKQVEGKRGVGYDRGLRLGYSKVEVALSSIRGNTV